ncbi:Basic-leucine zipper (bZIP) transcription factor [Ceratocystis lukuohia]|uniref:Basic-leucine zipper (BZIP) transcription factor n=1 Tax=Ceratocystis lukuohia TaxID=2019550 RepID=A0ABR4MHJ0_9PEZI
MLPYFSLPILGERNRESKEHAQRAERNRIHASSSYRIPTPSDLGPENEVSGLPWGSINIGHVVSRGLDDASRRSNSHAGRPSAAEAEASARSIFGSVSPVPSVLSSYPPPERAPTSVPCSSASTSPGQASQAQTRAQSQPQEGYHQNALRPSGLIPIPAPTPQSTGADQFNMPWFQDVAELVYHAPENHKNQNQDRNRNQDQ